jgi:endo-beta-N-acetylglucosaminidase D
MPKIETKKYLGDGVYADIERDMIKLTTENGISVTNEIFLELEVYGALVRFVQDALADGTTKS